MKRVEHLEDLFLHVVFDSDAGAEGATVFSSVKDDGHDFALRTLSERAGDLAHHLDVEDVQWRPRERDSGDAIFETKMDVLVCCRQVLLDRIYKIKQDLPVNPVKMYLHVNPVRMSLHVNPVKIL